MQARRESKHQLFFLWGLFAGLLVFVTWLAWDYGLLAQVFERDPTQLSKIICLLFVGATMHCALRAWYLSSQLASMHAIRQAGNWPGSFERRVARSLPAAYFTAIMNKYDQAEDGTPVRLHHEQLTEVLAEQARGEHETGWFLAGVLIKLGLIGTVVGFVLMLRSVSSIESFDINDVQAVLQQMTVGMSVALNTTLAGLIGSMLLGLQYLMLDRGADRLVASAVHFAEVQLFQDPCPLVPD